MAWLYSRSSTWRKIVNVTQSNPLYMAGFAAAAVGVPIYLAGAVQGSTNSEKQFTALEKELRARSSVDSQVLATAQKERLQVLLDEIKSKKGGEERYKAALSGKSLGTHSSGTTSGAVAIKRQQEED